MAARIEGATWRPCYADSSGQDPSAIGDPFAATADYAPQDPGWIGARLKRGDNSRLALVRTRRRNDGTMGAVLQQEQPPGLSPQWLPSAWANYLAALLQQEGTSVAEMTAAIATFGDAALQSANPYTGVLQLDPDTISAELEQARDAVQATRMQQYQEQVGSAFRQLPAGPGGQTWIANVSAASVDGHGRAVPGDHPLGLVGRDRSTHENRAWIMVQQVVNGTPRTTSVVADVRYQAGKPSLASLEIARNGQPQLAPEPALWKLWEAAAAGDVSRDQLANLGRLTEAMAERPDPRIRESIWAAAAQIPNVAPEPPRRPEPSGDSDTPDDPELNVTVVDPDFFQAISGTGQVPVPERDSGRAAGQQQQPLGAEGEAGLGKLVAGSRRQAAANINHVVADPGVIAAAVEEARLAAQAAGGAIVEPKHPAAAPPAAASPAAGGWFSGGGKADPGAGVRAIIGNLTKGASRKWNAVVIANDDFGMANNISGPDPLAEPADPDRFISSVRILVSEPRQQGRAVDATVGYQDGHAVLQNLAVSTRENGHDVHDENLLALWNAAIKAKVPREDLSNLGELTHVMATRPTEALRKEIAAAAVAVSERSPTPQAAPSPLPKRPGVGPNGTRAFVGEDYDIPVYRKQPGT